VRYFAASLLLPVLFGFSAVSAAQGKPAAEEEGEDMVEELEKVRKKVLNQGKVCPDPARPCPDFKPNELSFAIEPRFSFDRAEDRSQPFYAVILKSGPLCGIQEAERAKAQAQFPARKVFLHRLHCEGFSDKTTYTNVNRKAGFIGVYAGETEAEGRRFLAEAKAAGFGDANLRRMRAVVIYQLE
jgi:hypothetical protein